MPKPIIILAGQSNARRVSSEVKNQLDATYGDDNYILLKVHAPGAPLTRSRSNAPDWQTPGELRTQLATETLAVLHQNPGSYVSGMIWLQGEADALNIADTTTYKSDFLHLLDEFRSTIIGDLGQHTTGVEEMDILISNLSAEAGAVGSYGNWQNMRDILHSLGQENQHITTINPDAIASASQISPARMFDDHLHYSKTFRKSIAESVVTQIFDLASGKVRQQTGSNGNDIFDVALGISHAIGGRGDDVYYIDHVLDKITEKKSEGYDLVISSISYALRHHSKHTEELRLAGNLDINGAGNARDNVITGNNGDNRINGGCGNDTIDGGAGNDTLFGADGRDRFQDSGGADHMFGGDGRDVYIVDHSGDTVSEKAAQGYDKVKSSVSFDLSQHSEHIEKLVLTGAGHISGSGNSKANWIVGNTGNNELKGAAGDDTLDGGQGRDTLYGGQGNDVLAGGNDADLFIFVDGFGRDKILDFSPDETGEKIDLSALQSIDDFADLTENHLWQSKNKVVIEDAGGNRIVIRGLGVEDLSADDFLF